MLVTNIMMSCCYCNVILFLILILLSYLTTICNTYHLYSHRLIKSSSQISPPSKSPSRSRSLLTTSLSLSDKKGALTKPPLELCDENMLIVMEEVKEELGTIFGYDRGSRDVGITGNPVCIDDVLRYDYVDMMK